MESESSGPLRPALKRADVEALMARCQAGVGGRNALDSAHTIMAECYGTLGRQQIEIDLLRAALAALESDAERYRWLRSRKGLDLSTARDHCVWTRLDGTTFNASHYLAEGGTQHAPAESLDATIDAAMLVTRARGG